MLGRRAAERLPHPLAYLTLPTRCSGPLAFTATADSWQQPAEVSRRARSTATPAASRSPARRLRSAPLRTPRRRACSPTSKASSPSGYNFRLTATTTPASPTPPAAPLADQEGGRHPAAGGDVNPSVGAGLGACTPGPVRGRDRLHRAGRGLPQRLQDRRLHGPHAALRRSASKARSTSPSPTTRRPQPGRREPLRLAGRRLPGRQAARARDPGQARRQDRPRPRRPATSPRPSTACPSSPTPTSTSTSAPASGPSWSPRPPAAPAITQIELTPWAEGQPADHSTTASDDRHRHRRRALPAPARPPFAPGAVAGGVNSNVGSYTPYFVHLTRQDTEQEITSYSLVLPKGITGKLAGIPFCPEAAIEAARAKQRRRRDRQPLLPGGQPGRPHPDRLRGRLRPHLRPRPDLPRRPLPRRAALAGHDQPGHGRPLRPRHDRDPLGLPGRPAHRPAADRLRAPRTRSPTSSTASRCTCATSASTSTAPSSPTTPPAAKPSAADLDPDRLGRRLRRPRRRLARRPSPSTSSCSTASPSASSPSSACACAAARKRGAYPSAAGHLRRAAGPQDSNLKRIEVTMPHSEFLAQEPHPGDLHPRRSSTPKNAPPDSVYGTAVAYTPLFDEPLRGNVYLRSSTNTPARPGRLAHAAARCGSSSRARSARPSRAASAPSSTNVPDAPIDRFVMTLNGGKRRPAGQLRQHLRRPADGDRQSARPEQHRRDLHHRSCAGSARARGQGQEAQKRGEEDDEARFASDSARAGLRAGRSCWASRPARAGRTRRPALRLVPPSRRRPSEPDPPPVGDLGAPAALAVDAARRLLRLRLLPPRGRRSSTPRLART